MERPVRFDAAMARRLLFSGQGLLFPVSLHLAARNAAAISFRSINEFWLEVSGAGRDYQHRANRHPAVAGRV